MLYLTLYKIDGIDTISVDEAKRVIFYRVYYNLRLELFLTPNSLLDTFTEFDHFGHGPLLNKLRFKKKKSNNEVMT